MNAPTGPPADVLAALFDPRLYLVGNEDGHVELQCHDCWDGGRPLAYLDRHGGTYPDAKVVPVETLPALAGFAHEHLRTRHP
ncbi:hypothetical protein ACFOWE_18200 [Planomonospora corallina]|uniref:Uncharacterized protein n=1 Tax=Planomonospora corallina TaxID=1806052 RepID=A0ABV8IEJ0_9ACTN